MLRRVLFVAAAILLLSPVGCRQILSKDGSFSELRNHALRLDYEFQELHYDIKEIVFGLDGKPSSVALKANIYE